ncbi:Reticulon [Fusarium acutatum]|uniref:Reticulon n=1 Tax=Fusarium acutatum TaxID=78861 RepID=A0A8H4J8J0_9HYPO|nr:Reticulon [Fusarium acutatum]
MSAPAVVIMPVQANGAQQSEQDPSKLASAIQQTLEENISSSDRNLQGENGPLKELIAHQESLYKYISWEDPVRTLGSYLVALSILIGTHCLPLTQLMIKVGAVVFGIISLAEFVSRTFGPNTFLSRLRPKEYKTVPEPILNATLRDIHDFIQYAVVQVQKLIFGQDLSKTFAASLGFTALFWLMKVASPFSLAVLGLSSLYIAPLINSLRGRTIAQDATARGKELASAATEKGNTLARDSKAKATELTSKARETTGGVQQRVKSLAHNGKQTANELSTQANDRATTENDESLKDMGIDAISKAPSIAKRNSGDVEQYALDMGYADYRHDARGEENNASQFSTGIDNTPRQMVPRGTTADRAHCPNTVLENQDNMASSMSN